MLKSITLTNNDIYKIAGYIQNSTNGILLPIELSFYFKQNFNFIISAAIKIAETIEELKDIYKDNLIKYEQEKNKLMRLTQEIQYYPISRSQLKRYNYPQERLKVFNFMLF